MRDSAEQSDTFRRRVVTIVVIVAVAALLIALVLRTVGVLVLVFFSILIAVMLRGLARWLRARTQLSDTGAVVTVVAGIVVLFALVILLLGPGVAAQTDQLIEQVPQSLQQLNEWLTQYEWGRQLLAQAPTADDLNDIVFGRDGDVFAQVTGVFSTTLGVLGNAFIVFLVGIFLAFEPHLYIENALRLLPQNRRERARQVFATLGDTLARWLLGRFVSMALIGVLTTVGLIVLGVPIALTLGLIAGLLSFIPNFGPILALIPAVLLALLQSPAQALYVVVLYLAVQAVDNYLVTPYIERRTVSLPPALTIVAQLVFGIVVGRLGLILAAPLLAVIVVLVRMLYVEDVLHDYRPTPPAQALKPVQPELPVDDGKRTTV
jgi:predicted PurR-regulated permease PerM